MLNKKYFYLFLSGYLLLSGMSSGYALPFNVIPNRTLPLTAPSSASYTITNNTLSNSTGNLVKWLPPNVAINSTGTTCSPTNGFSLAPQASCILNLTVTGAVNRSDSNPHNHLFICMSDTVSCAGPAPLDSLNVAQASAQRVAVGFFNNGSVDVPLTYTSPDNGNTWAVSAILPAYYGTDSDSLTGVACDSTGTLCSAVGFSNLTSPIPLSYISRDGGSTWVLSQTLPPLPLPSLRGPGTPNSLRSVACSSAGLQCTTVGSYSSSPSLPLSYISLDGGNTWVLSQTLPPTVGSSINSLQSVACSSNGLNCAAIGDYSNGSTTLGLSYITNDGGNNWALSNTLPPQIGGSNIVLNSVACDSQGINCAAVGSYTNGTTLPLSYISKNGGNTWTVSAVLPPNISTANTLTSIACDSAAQNCVTVGYTGAVGARTPGSSNLLSYISHDGGNTWAVSAVPPSISNGLQYTLTSVICDSTGQSCTAVGSVIAITSHSVANSLLAFVSNDGGNTWAISQTLPPLQSNAGSILNGVAGAS